MPGPQEGAGPLAARHDASGFRAGRCQAAAADTVVAPEDLGARRRASSFPGPSKLFCFLRTSKGFTVRRSSFAGPTRAAPLVG